MEDFPWLTALFLSVSFMILAFVRGDTATGVLLAVGTGILLLEGAAD